MRSTSLRLRTHRGRAAEAARAPRGIHQLGQLFRHLLPPARAAGRHRAAVQAPAQASGNRGRELSAIARAHELVEIGTGELGMAPTADATKGVPQACDSIKVFGIPSHSLGRTVTSAAR